MTKLRLNLEHKARLHDVAQAEAALRAISAIESGILVQRDTYFHVESGRLKLRETPDRAELIAYERDETGPDMLSRYTVTAVAQADVTRDDLAARYGVRGVVEKSRSLWLHKNARIHLDHVGGLGSFLEIEVVEPRTPDEGRAFLDELVVTLSLDRAAALRMSYIDLLELTTTEQENGDG